MKNNYPVIIFDFDGTIANTIPAFEQIYSSLAKKFRLKPLGQKDIESFRHSSVQEIMNKIGLTGFNLIKLPFIIKAGRAEIKKEIHLFKPIPGIDKTLKELKTLGYKIGIITSNSVENVKEFLKINNLNVFDFIYSGGVFGKDKNIRQFISKNKLTPEDVLYVGDELRDIDAANKIGVRIISVTWGLSSKKALENKIPTYIVDNPEELLKVIKTQPPF